MKARKSVIVGRELNGMGISVWLSKIVLVEWSGIRTHGHANVLLSLYGMVGIVQLTHAKEGSFGTQKKENVNVQLATCSTMEFVLLKAKYVWNQDNGIPLFLDVFAQLAIGIMCIVVFLSLTVKATK